MVTPVVFALADFYQSETDASAINARISGVASGVLPAIEAVLINVSVPNGHRYRILGASCGGNGVGCFRLYKNDAIIEQKRTSYIVRQVSLQDGLLFSSGDELKLSVINETIVGENNDYQAFIFLRDDII